MALRGIDVLISTLSTGALAPQVPLAQAAKAAGVKLFVPSEFGNPTLDKHGHPGPLGQKADLHGTLKKLELPYALFYTGPWPEYNLVP